jgi:hypothetical protein
MNSVLLESAIRTRLIQSAATEGVAIQGCWSTIAPEGIEPVSGSNAFIVFELLSGTEDDTFDFNGVLCTYRVNIYTHRGNGTADAAALYGAVVGDGTPTTVPTKGLHRWQATVSGQSVTQARRVRFGYGHQGDVLHYYADFEIYAQQA